ncbi:winged helix-turn-helix domain-containing protein [Streptosporangium canum]|uniref:winged helix-turn-helix domain-containing protein n=1 Tax=Streptosporangium canum TaxID=324952 RepID=UPI0036C39A11
MTLDRWGVERAVKASSLASPSRLLMYTLLTHVTRGTLVVPAEYAPSLTKLVAETGLGRSTVAEHLNALERDGWLDRRRPTTKEAMADRARTGYRLKVPASVLAELEEEPVQEPDQSESRTSPGAGPVEQEDLFSAGPRAGLVQEPDGTSPGAGLNPKCFPKSSSSTKKKGGVGGNGRRPKAGDEEHPRFAEWYAAYPVHKAPGDARKAFNKAVTKVGDIETLIEGAKRYHHDRDYRRGFGKNPATWLNGECWLNESDPVLQATGTDGRPSNGSGPSAQPPQGHIYDPEAFFGKKGRS